MMDDPQPNYLRQTLSHGIQSILINLRAIATRIIRWWQILEPQHEKVLLGLGVGMVLIMVIFAVWKIPQRQVAPLKAKIEREKETGTLKPEERLKLEHDVRKLENDARTTLVQPLGGLALLLGLIFTWRSIRATERNLQITQQIATENLAVAQDGQITERFTRAIDQLGNRRVEVQLGGIYALARIANESEDDRIPIIEILTAFVRMHSPWPPKDGPIETDLLLSVRAPAIQAIMTVLGRREIAEGETIKFRGEIEFNGDLIHTEYRTGSLFEVRLELSNVDLRKADLAEANLTGAMLVKSNLKEADVREAQLRGADLRAAILKGVKFHNTDLYLAQLYGAHLEGADLTRALNLETASLQGAQADYNTMWPSGFNWQHKDVSIVTADLQQP